MNAKIFAHTHANVNEPRDHLAAGCGWRINFADV
jgi:hypothetical protein